MQYNRLSKNHFFLSTGMLAHRRGADYRNEMVLSRDISITQMAKAEMEKTKNMGIVLAAGWTDDEEN
jgi:hypothetical protein